jgi:hypothetical protein
MPKVLFLLDQPLDWRNYKRFGIQTWIDRGWDVDILNLTPKQYMDIYLKGNALDGRLTNEACNQFTINSYGGLKHWFKCLTTPPLYYIDLSGVSGFSFLTRAYLYIAGSGRIVINLGLNPGIDIVGSSLIKKFISWILKSPKSCIKLVWLWVLKDFSENIFKPSVIVFSGRVTTPEFAGSAILVPAHNFDYDQYLGLVESKENPKKNYAVFLDQNYCFHTDFLNSLEPHFVTVSEYYPILVHGLRRIETSLNLDIKIAQHPRSIDHAVADYFHPYQVERNKSAVLVRDSKVVIAHDSSSIQFAILFFKPIIFFTTNQLAPQIEGKYIEMIASKLGKNVINLNNCLDEIVWEKELEVNVQKYKAYIDNYIKMDGTPTVPLWEVVISSLGG